MFERYHKDIAEPETQLLSKARVWTHDVYLQNFFSVE